MMVMASASASASGPGRYVQTIKVSTNRRAPNERRRRARHHRHADRVCVCQLAVWPQGPHQALDRVVHAKLRGDNWTHCTAVDEYTSIIRQGIRWERPALLKAVLDHHRWLHHGDLDEPREATHTRVLDGGNFIFRHRVEWSRSGRRGAVRGRQVVEVARGNSRGKTRADSLRMKWRTRAYDECINANAGWNDEWKKGSKKKGPIVNFSSLFPVSLPISTSPTWGKITS